MDIDVSKGFQGEEFEVVASSGRKYLLRELNASQQMDADAMAEAGNVQAQNYFRAAAAIVKIDGKLVQPLPPGNAASTLMRARLNQIPGRDLDEIFVAYVRKCYPQALDVKNESTPVV